MFFFETGFNKNKMFFNNKLPLLYLCHLVEAPLLFPREPSPGLPIPTNEHERDRLQQPSGLSRGRSTALIQPCH